MECTISKLQLQELIQRSYPFIPLKSSLQILSNFKFSFFKEKIEVKATDLDHSIIASSPVSCSEEKEMAVNAKKLFEIVRELPEGDIHLKDYENVLSIESNMGFSCKIAGTNTNDFPEFPLIEKGVSFEISTQSLKDLIVKSSFAVSKDESRNCLCGIFWIIENSKTGMVATDGHRLGCSFINGNYSVQEKQTMIVSPKTLHFLIRIFDSVDEKNTISVTKDEKYVVFSNEQLRICSKLIEGPYPDYEKAIPKNSPKIAILEKDKFFEAIKRVSILSNQKTHLVKCLFQEKEVELSVLNRDIGGEAHEIVSINYNGEMHTIGFNSQYMIEILSLIKQQKIRLEMNTQISACLLFPEYAKEEDKKSDDTFLIMPLRIMEEI